MDERTAMSEEGTLPEEARVTGKKKSNKKSKKSPDVTHRERSTVGVTLARLFNIEDVA